MHINNRKFNGDMMFSKKTNYKYYDSTIIVHSTSTSTSTST